MTTRKTEILQTTARLFRKKGYKATSMRAIAEEVGIKAASIYNHFRSKQEMLEVLLMDIAEQFTAGMSEIDSTGKEATKKLSQLIELHVKLTVEYTDAIALIAAEWVHLEEPAKSEYLTLRTTYEKAFKSILEQGKVTNQFQQVDTEIALFSILSTLRWLYSWYSRNKQYDVEKLKDQIKTCLLNGIKV